MYSHASMVAYDQQHKWERELPRAMLIGSEKYLNGLKDSNARISLVDGQFVSKLFEVLAGMRRFCIFARCHVYNARNFVHKCE
jgi:hypothetical protein